MKSFLHGGQYCIFISSQNYSFFYHPGILPYEYFGSKLFSILFSNASTSCSGLDLFKYDDRQLSRLWRQVTYLCWFLNFLLIGKSSNLSKFCKNQRQSCSVVVPSLITLHKLRYYRQILCKSTYLPLFYSALNQGYLNGAMNTILRKYSTVFLACKDDIWLVGYFCFLYWSFIQRTLSQKFCHVISEAFFLSDGRNDFCPSIIDSYSFFIPFYSLRNVKISDDFCCIIVAKFVIRCSANERSFGLSCRANSSLTIAFSNTSTDSTLNRSSQNQLVMIFTRKKSSTYFYKFTIQFKTLIIYSQYLALIISSQNLALIISSQNLALFIAKINYKFYQKQFWLQNQRVHMIKDDPRVDQIRSVTKVYVDFPKKGINFLDIFPIVANARTLSLVTDIFIERLQNQLVQYDKIFMLESRGFLFGVPLSQKTGKPCYPIRKKGKLPGECLGIGYGLQYGKDEIQVQKFCLSKGDKVVIIDDVLATGGTLNAAIDLIRQAEAEVVHILLVNRVESLNGLQRLNLHEEKVFYIYDI